MNRPDTRAVTTDPAHARFSSTQADARQVESNLRAKLDIADDAESVLIFGESSHWDPNWLLTTEEYFEKRIGHVIDRAIEELVAQPRRIFSIECVYFLELYWDRRPEQREVLQDLINTGRLRLTGSGITTPDTVLPDTEAILRDYLHGQEWLRRQGLHTEPRLAYLPDDFGYSPALPSVLAALGYDMACITRIDGMYFVGSDYRRRSRFPLPGSSAEVLLKGHKTLDFVWRAPDCSEVLCHWNAFTYFQGDMLAHLGIIRWMGTTYGCSYRTERHIARRIRSYVRQLRPISPTPYMYCPIGCDFNDPIESLVDLLDRYNATRYGDTGVWAVNAGMDDYLTLVNCYRAKLPVLQLDPNPYWMGFYASRQEAKLRCNRIARKAVLAEKLSAVDEATSATPRQLDASTPDSAATDLMQPTAATDSGLSASETTGTSQPVRDKLARAWDLLVLSNHHDFITGTSPDRVWEAEQQPWLREAEGLVDLALSQVSPLVLASTDRVPPPRWQLHQGHLEVTTPHFAVQLSEEAGGCFISFKDAQDGHELLTGPANDLIAYRDTGGLWRMGHEYCGGAFRERVRASKRPAIIRATEKGDLLEVRVESELCGRRLTRWIWFRSDSPVVRMRLVGAAAKRRSITCRFPTTLCAGELSMNVPGGIVSRPAHKLYCPTFWPARSFAHIHDRASDRGLATFLGGPAAASLTDAGAVELLAFRNAPREMAWGVLPVLAHPARGTDPHDNAFDYAIWYTRQGDWRDNHLPSCVRTALRAAMFAPDAPDLDQEANAVVIPSTSDVLVTALKVASRGLGVIARLHCYCPRGTEVRLQCTRRAIKSAHLCDARERDIGPIALDNGAAVLETPGSLCSVRLMF
jgi:hypothetical protein